MNLRGIKHIMVATALAVATVTAGMAGQAQAFSFGDGDLVLAIYGNNTEALFNLGAATTQLANGQSFTTNVLAGLQAASVGTNPVKYTVFGHDLFGSNVFAGTSVNPSSINPVQLGIPNQLSASANAQGFITFTGDTIAKADPLRSFTANFNQDGSGTFGGSWTVQAQGGIGNLLNILRGNADTLAWTQVGRALLTADGQFTIGNPGPNPAPVPLPAAVVLFGSGLIGLIGIARRSFTQKAS